MARSDFIAAGRNKKAGDRPSATLPPRKKGETKKGRTGNFMMFLSLSGRRKEFRPFSRGMKKQKVGGGRRKAEGLRPHGVEGQSRRVTG
jgi:hypothetical protein